MPSDLFSATYARGAAAEAVSAESWLAAMVEVEATLTRACVAEGLIPSESGEAILAGLRDPTTFDLAAITAEAGNHASPVVPLVRALRERVAPEHRSYVHLGATSQDIVDTAAMLVSRRALAGIIDDAQAAARACAVLATEHRETVMSGRTLLQQALPTSFGLRAAGWLTAINTPLKGLEGIVTFVLAVQMGGPVGNRAPAVAGLMAAELGLVDPVLPWHTDRSRIVDLGATLAMLTGAFGKLARDVSLLAQTEIGEVREGAEGRGGSSAMAHKRNPVAAVSVLACSRRIPGLVATLLAGMEQEHERAAGAWQAEWGTLCELLSLSGSVAAWGRDLLEHLEVDTERMRTNLATLAAMGVEQAAAPERHLAGTAELIDRALGDFNR